MTDDHKLIAAFDLIRKAFSDAYKRGKADAISAMLKAATGEMQQGLPKETEVITDKVWVAPDDDQGRKRAPRGSAERVIKRAITASDGRGATVQDILAARIGDDEMMLADSSVRGELRRGEKLEPPKYVELDGRWFTDPT